jgi:transposase
VSEDYGGRQYVGMDLHLRRSVLVRMTDTGERLEAVRIVNDRQLLAQVMARAGEDPEVVLEATYGWYWAADTLAELGACVHLAHPLGVKGFAYRRVKNDVRDASDLADLLRMERLPEAWIAPPAVRELRELVRHRRKLRQMAVSIKAQVRAVLAKCGLSVSVADLFCLTGSRQLAALPLPEVFRARVDSQLRVLDAINAEIDRFDKRIAALLREDRGYRVIQQVPGVGPVLAAVFIAEIGDVTRFAQAGQLCCWAGLTPKHRESDVTVHRGAITKQGSRLVRWAAVEAGQRAPKDSLMGRTYGRIVERRGGKAKNLAKVAAARKLLTLVYYGLRDGQIRCLARRAAA